MALFYIFDEFTDKVDGKGALALAELYMHCGTLIPSVLLASRSSARLLDSESGVPLPALSYRLTHFSQILAAGDTKL
jgi:hypothetical protein